MSQAGLRLIVVAALISGALRNFAQAPPPQNSPIQPSQTQSNPAPQASPLAPIAWMAGSWAAEAKQPGSDKSSKILSKFTPQLDGRTMAIETSFDSHPVYQGMFAYDPAQKAIAFWYVTPDGESIRGTVDPRQTAELLFDFRMAIANGAELHFQTVIHRVDQDHYTWALFTNSKGTTWDKLFEVEYHRVS